MGECDDSPGVQGLGTLLVVGMIVLSVRTARRNTWGSTRVMLIVQEYEEDMRKNH